jgi:hypothetical protein
VKVFISYAQDRQNPTHADKVRAMAERLKSLAVDVLIDLDDIDPEVGWLNWMENQLRAADVVLLVCSETYIRRFNNEETGSSYGVRWEGILIRNLIGVAKEQLSKYVPVLFEGGDLRHIPLPLQDRSRYQLKTFSADDPEFVKLVKRLTGRDLESDGGAARPRLLEFGIAPRSENGSTVAYNVRLESEGLGAEEEDFDGDPLNETETNKALDDIASGRVDKDSLKWVGMQLWEGLFTGKVRELFQKARRKGFVDGRMFHLRLRLPTELESLPWEALFDAQEKMFVGTREQFCVIRTGARRFDPASPRPAGGSPPAVLVVLPKGSGLNLARERGSILTRVAATNGAVQVEVLDGVVTVKALRERIQSRPWAVVHYAGHGRVNDGGEVELQLNDDAGEARWVDTDVFATLFNKGAVRLVLLNCCRGASVAVARGVAAMGPVLITQGVAAVIAMRYEVTDDLAVSFADEFYRALLEGALPGRVDVAMEAARLALFWDGAGDRHRGFITPALYLAPGGEQLFDLPKVQAPVVSPAAMPEPGNPTQIHALAALPDSAVRPPQAEIPKKLVLAVRDRLCIPVLGEGLLTAEVFRDAPPPPGLRALTKKLADVSGYPEPADFELLERGGTWLDGLILHRVCQYYIDDEDRAADLNRLIEEEFRESRPPKAVQTLAGWNVPGYICLHFDGLLEQELIARGRRFIALTLDDPTPGDLEILRLVQLCGSCRGRDKKAAALTEQKHDALWDRLARPPDWLTNLITAVDDRSLLFLGVHPRDPLARRLASRLYAKGVANDAGPIFFVTTEQVAADQAYWKNFNVRWVKRSPADLIDEIGSMASSGGEGGRP